MAKVKFNLSVEQEVLDYLKREADRIGITVAALITIMVAERKEKQGKE